LAIAIPRDRPFHRVASREKTFMNNPIFRWYRSALRHPQYRWWIILGTCAYLLSPIDISPDLVPLLGQIDDAAIVMLLISELYQIFTEWVEARRETAIPTNPASNSAPETATSESQTVDVDAVSIE
jgi:uncharacterized membrane protein YkvA (DUF1232 family)